jgi:hypothetical protein
MPDAQCSPLPNALKHGFYSRRFSNRSFSNRSFCDRCLSGQEHLDLETLSEEGLDSEIAMLTNYLISRLSSFVCRPSSVAHASMHFASEASKYASIHSLDAKYSFLIVSRLFITQKYSALNPLPRRRHQVSPDSNPLPGWRRV